MDFEKLFWQMIQISTGSVVASGAMQTDWEAGVNWGKDPMYTETEAADPWTLAGGPSTERI